MAQTTKPPLPDTKEEQDAAYNPGDLHAAEQFNHYASGGIEEAQKYANKDVSPNIPGTDKPDKTFSNLDNVKESENSSNWTNNYTGRGSDGTGGRKKPLSLKATLAKKGPIGLILAVLGIGGVSMVGFTSFLPMQLRAAMENFYGNASRASTIHYKANLRYGIGNSEACKNPNSVKCKTASITDDTKKQFEKQGFKVDSTKVGDRHVINAITFPDGTAVNSGDAFIAKMDSSPENRSHVYGVFNPRSGPYSGQRFTTKVLNKFGVNKTKVKLSGKDREAASKSFNREVGAPEDRGRDADEARSRIESEVKGKAVKVAGKVTNILGVACSAYDMTRVTLALIKAKNAAKYVAFAYLFIKLADQIRAGDADPVTLAVAGGVLTKIASNGPNAGKSATDSPGYRAVAYGDRTKLADTMQKILLGGNPALKKLDDTVIYIKGLLGSRTTHSACKASNDPAIGSALTVAMCAGGGGAGGSILPGLGTAVGGIGGTILCTAGNLAVAIVGSLIIGEIIERIMPSVIEYLKGAPLDYDMSSVDAGNAITIGAGLLFATTGQAAGMKLGTKEEVNAFHKVTASVDKEYEEMARYEAKATPFDITNQYSFMGQLFNQINVGSGSNVVASTLSTVGMTLSNVNASMLSTAANAADMPSPINSATMGKCYDAELVEKNVACDTVGIPQAVQTQEEMGRPTEANYNYMINNGYVSEEGTVNPDKEYAKYVQYCTGEGPEAPGSSSVSIADDDYEWIETRCQESSEMVSNFRTYTSRTGGSDDRDTAYKDADIGTTEEAAVATEGEDIAGDDYKSEVRSVLGRAGTGQCVDFVLFRLVKHKVLKGPIALGNGKDVVGTLGRMGYKVDTTPAVHSVMSTPVTSTPQYGHTAMVSAVHADGSFTVEEYNYGTPLHYGTRKISAAEIKSKKMTFAHTEVDYK